MPEGMVAIGRSLIFLGVILVLVGIALVLFERFPGIKLGRLPGDIYINKGGWRFYFPLMTSIILSVILSLILWLFSKK